MALIKCPECGKEVSDRAGSCPNCAFPLSSMRTDGEVSIKLPINLLGIRMDSTSGVDKPLLFA